MFNKVLSLLVNSPSFDRMVSLLERMDPQRPNYLRVLTYHRIDDPSGFEEQMSYLARRYPVVSAGEVLAAFERKKVLAPGSIMITFDDAYRNFLDVAWPALKRHDLPVTLFVPTAYPDHPERTFWWDRLEQALESTPRRDRLQTPVGSLPLSTAAQRRAAEKKLKNYLVSLSPREMEDFTEWLCLELRPGRVSSEDENPVLGWDELRRLAAEGVVLGAHTRTHPLMNQVTTVEARSEAAGSLQDLKKEIGQVLPIFAYPGGRFNEAVVEGLRQDGFSLAFTTIRGTNILPTADPLRIRRINIGRQANQKVLRVRLLHASATLNRFRPLSRRETRPIQVAKAPPAWSKRDSR